MASVVDSQCPANIIVGQGCACSRDGKCLILGGHFLLNFNRVLPGNERAKFLVCGIFRCNII